MCEVVEPALKPDLFHRDRCDVKVDDFVLIHVGYALNKVSPEEAELTLAMFAEAGLVERNS